MVNSRQLSPVFPGGRPQQASVLVVRPGKPPDKVPHVPHLRRKLMRDSSGGRLDYYFIKGGLFPVTCLFDKR